MRGEISMRKSEYYMLPHADDASKMMANAAHFDVAGARLFHLFLYQPSPHYRQEYFIDMTALNAYGPTRMACQARHMPVISPPQRHRAMRVVKHGNIEATPSFRADDYESIV